MQLCCHHRRVTQRKPSPKTQSRLRGLPSQRNMQQRKRNTFFPQRARQPKQQGTRRTLNSIFKAYIAALRDAKKLAVSSGTTLAQKSRTGEDSALCLPSTAFQSHPVVRPNATPALRAHLFKPKAAFQVLASSEYTTTAQTQLDKNPRAPRRVAKSPKKKLHFFGLLHKRLSRL